MWPFFERLVLFQSIVGIDLSKFPALEAWCKAMSEDPVAKECTYPAEMYMKYFEGFRTGNPDAQLIGIDQRD